MHATELVPSTLNAVFVVSLFVVPIFTVTKNMSFHASKSRVIWTLELKQNFETFMVFRVVEAQKYVMFHADFFLQSLV